MGSLEGKSALVTGAGRGIGEATARKLASHGARVLVNDLDADVAEAVAASIPGAVAFPADLTDPAAADQVVNAAIDALGGLDIVVNNAGYIWHSAIHVGFVNMLGLTIQHAKSSMCLRPWACTAARLS
jgi:3-oxoacyl-[acyl-carrier protein] reductase